MPTGTEGELQLKGYSVFPGYLNNPDANARAFAEDGFFRTGDLATVDADGNVVITGRVKDVINRGGIKINPTDVENLLQAHPAIVLAAVVPMPDEVLGERMCLFVTLAPGASLAFEEMTGYLERNGIAKMRWPERLENRRRNADDADPENPEGRTGEAGGVGRGTAQARNYTSG